MNNQRITTEEQLLDELMKLGFTLDRLREKSEIDWDSSIDIEIVTVNNRIQSLIQQHKAVYEVKS